MPAFVWFPETQLYLVKPGYERSDVPEPARYAKMYLYAGLPNEE